METPAPTRDQRFVIADDARSPQLFHLLTCVHLVNYLKSYCHLHKNYCKLHATKTKDYETNCLVNSGQSPPENC